MESDSYQKAERRTDINLKALILCGIGAYVVTFILLSFFSSPEEDALEYDWIGEEIAGVIWFQGRPDSVDYLDDGSSVVHFHHFFLEDDHYAVDDIVVEVDPQGIVRNVTVS